MALKTPFCAQEDELLNLIALSCGRVAHGGRTNASCGPFAQYLNVTTGAIAPPPPRVVSEEFFGNQFSQFVVIFLFQGLRNSSPITNLSPQDC